MWSVDESRQCHHNCYSLLRQPQEKRSCNENQRQRGSRVGGQQRLQRETWLLHEALSPCCPAPWVGRSAHVLGMAVVVMSHAEQDTADNEASLPRQRQEQRFFYHQQHPGREGPSHFLPIIIATVPSWLLARFPQHGENLSSVCGGYPQGCCHTAHCFLDLLSCVATMLQLRARDTSWHSSSLNCPCDHFPREWPTKETGW